MRCQIVRIGLIGFGIMVPTFLLGSADCRAQDVPKSTAPDLTTFSLMPGASPRQHSISQLSYDVSSTVRDAFEFQVQQLDKRGWKRLEGSYESDTSSSAAFEKNGYKLSLSVYSGGSEGKTGVMLMQHGNVDLQKLPLPADLKLFYGGPAIASYLTEVSVDKTKEACRELLVKSGWEPYGVAGDSLMFRKNQTRLNAYISAAPAQGGKTMAQFSSELLGFDLPLFPGSLNVQYSDNPAQLFFDSGKSMDEVVGFYKQSLGQSGWQPTTESLNKVSIYQVMIFRNASHDMMRLQLHNFEQQARVLLRFFSAQEVADLELRARQQAQERMKQATPAKHAEVLEIDVPAGAKQLKIDGDTIEFQLAAGQARNTVENWRQQFLKAGWKEQSAVLEKVAGVILLTSESKTLTISYTDTGFMPAEVSMDATGLQLQRKSD